MNKRSGIVVVVVFTLLLLGVALVPLQNAILQSDMNGGNFSITNLHNASAQTLTLGGVTITTWPGGGGPSGDAPLPDTTTIVSNANLGTWSVGSIAASQIGSGTIATARLGSGTANAGAALLGNQTWGAMTNLTTGDSSLKISGGVIDSATILQSLASLANASGFLQNNGSGGLSWGSGGSSSYYHPLEFFTNSASQIALALGLELTNLVTTATGGSYPFTVNNSSGNPVFQVDINGNINGGFTPSSTMYIGGMTVLNNLIVDGTLEELGTQTANAIKAGPVSGSAAAPTYRAMVQADLPASISGIFAGFATLTNASIWNPTNNVIQSSNELFLSNLRNAQGSFTVDTNGNVVGFSDTTPFIDVTGLAGTNFTFSAFGVTNNNPGATTYGLGAQSSLSISNAYASNLFASIGIFGAIQETNGWTNFLTSLQMTDGNGNYGGVGAGYSNWPISFGTNTYGIFTTNIGLCISNVQGLAANSANYVRVFISYTNFTSGNATEYISFAGTDIYPNLSGMGNGFQIQQKVGITTPTYMLEGYIWGTNWQGPLAVWRLSQPGGNVQYYYAGASLSSIGVTGFTNGGNYISLNGSVVLNPTTGQDVYVQNGSLWLSLVGEYIQNGFLQFNNYLFPGSNLNFGLFGYTNTIPTQITEQHGPQSILQTSNVQAMAITATNSLYLPFLTPSSLIMTGIGDLVQSVTLGTGLSFSGSTLNATGGGGSLNINTNNLNTAITNLNSLAVIVSNTWQWITNQYPGTNVTITPTNITVTGNLGYYGNGTNLQGVVTTNGAQQNYEPVFTPGSGVNGITWQPATNVDIVTTVTFSNIPPLTYYTNTSGSVQVYSVTISNQVAAVAGNATWTFAISNANSGGWSNQVVGLSTLITSISMNYTNDTIVILNTNAVLAMTNTSTGTGNVAGEVPSTGQIMTIGNATASGVPALGAANTFTSSMTIPVLFVKATMATAPQITIISVITNSSSNYVINFTATNVTAGTSPFGITNFWTFSTGAGTNQHATMMGSTHGKSLGSTVDTFTYPGWCYEFTNTGSTYGCLGSISNNPTFEGIQPPTVETAVATSVGYGPYFTPVSSTATTWTTAGTIYVSW